MDPEFDQRNKRLIEAMGKAKRLKELTLEWMKLTHEYEYSYHFTWLGRPVIQYPSDIVAIQELLWKVRPDMVLETGIARGGSLILSASILELLGGDRFVVGIDVDIRKHNRVEIEGHALAHRIQMIEGSSVDSRIVDQVRALSGKCKQVLVFLDSNHTHEHVLAELRAYSPLVRQGSYIVVFDTLIEDFPPHSFEDRPWDLGNNPKTAVREFLAENQRFDIDRQFQNKLMTTVAPEGFLRCVED